MKSIHKNENSLYPKARETENFQRQVTKMRLTFDINFSDPYGSFR